MAEDARPTQGTHSFQSGVVYTGSSSVVNIAALFLETIFAARLLPEEKYGIYVILIAVVNFLVVVVDFGCKTAITKMLASSDPEMQAALTNTVALFRVAILLVLSALIWLWHDLLLLLDPSQSFLQYAAFVPVMVAVASFDELFYSMLQGFRSYGSVAISQVIRGGLRLALSLTLLAVFHLGILALIYSWIISFAASSVYQFLVMPVPKRLFWRRPLLVEVLHFGFPLQLTRFLWYALRRADILLLAALAGPSSVAYYAVAARIPDALQRLSESYIAVYYPTVSALIANGKHQEATKVLNQSVRLLSLATALGAAGAILFSKQIMTLLFSGRYAVSALPFALLMVAFHAAFMISLIGFTLTAAGYPGRSLWANLARVTFNVTGDLALIQPLGVVGATTAAVISAYVTSPFAAWLLKRSGTPVAMTPFTKHAILLLLYTLAIWWVPDLQFVYRAVGFVLVSVLCMLAANLSRDDLKMFLPEELVRRFRGQREVLESGN